MRTSSTFARGLLGAVIAVAVIGTIAILTWEHLTIFGRDFDRRSVPWALVAAALAGIGLTCVPDWRTGLRRHHPTVIFLALFAVYMSTGHTSRSGDTIPMRYLPISLLREGDFDFDEFPALYTPGSGKHIRLPPWHPYIQARGGHEEPPYYFQYVGGHYVSTYPVAAGLLVLPVYVPSILGGADAESPVFDTVEKLGAALIVSLSAVFLYLALADRVAPGYALALTIVYGLGTSSLSISSQGMWQHGPSQLMIAAALWLTVRTMRQPTRWRYALLGFCLAAAVTMRPTDLLISAALGCYVLFRNGLTNGLPRIAWMVPGAAGPVAFQASYNLAYFGKVSHSAMGSSQDYWSTPLLVGLPGVLFSPGRGLFLYSPVMVFSVVAMAWAWTRKPDALVRWLSLGAVATVLLYSKWHMWWGGHSFGPRFLSDLTPILVFSIHLFANMRGWVLAVFIALSVWSIGLHAVGAYVGEGFWSRTVDIDQYPERVWWWLDNPIVNIPTRVMKVLRRFIGS